VLGIELKVTDVPDVGANEAIESNEGGTLGVTLLDAAEAADVPLALVAVTINV
jgi:hypothetical protein